MRMISVRILLVTLASSTIVYGTDLRGIVRDANDLPLQNATVTIYKVNSTFGRIAWILNYEIPEIRKNTNY